MSEVERHIDDIKMMRDEINWRVKLAYSGSVVFISIFTLLISYILNADKAEINNDNLSIIGLGTVTLIAIYIGILNANHLVEKRVEYYTLHLQKKILDIEGFPSYSWLSFLYGYKFVKNRILRVLSSWSNTSVGIFQYGIPILMALFTLIYLSVAVKAHMRYPLFFVFASTLVLLTFISSIFLLAFLSKMAKEQKEFFDHHILPYLNDLNSIKKNKKEGLNELPKK